MQRLWLSHCYWADSHNWRTLKIKWSFGAARKGFILSQKLGVYGYTFVDYGDEFMILDETGKDTKSFIVKSINNGEDPVVTVHDDKRHSFHDDSYIKFTEVQGMTQINETDPIRISVIDGFSFKLKLDTSKFDSYTREGIVVEVKVPKKHKFNSLREALVKSLESSPDQCFITTDFGFFTRPGVLHIALQGVLRFHQNNGRLPSNTDEDAQACLDNTKNINDELKGTEGAWAIDEFDAAIFNNVSRYASASISQVVAFFGGVVAQEVVKFTGKYTPITQWLHLDFFLSLYLKEMSQEQQATQGMTKRWHSELRF